MGRKIVNSNSFLEPESITDKIIMVNVNQTYKDGMSEEETYEMVRGIWVVYIERANLVDYVFAIFKGEIIEIYAPKIWQKAGETPYKFRDDLKDGIPENKKGRFEFIGSVASDAVRSLYVGKLINKWGQNPVRYNF